MSLPFSYLGLGCQVLCVAQTSLQSMYGKLNLTSHSSKKSEESPKSGEPGDAEEERSRKQRHNWDLTHVPQVGPAHCFHSCVPSHCSYRIQLPLVSQRLLILEWSSRSPPQLLPRPKGPQELQSVFLAGHIRVCWTELFNLAQLWLFPFSRRLAFAPLPCTARPTLWGDSFACKDSIQPSQLTQGFLLAEDSGAHWILRCLESFGVLGSSWEQILRRELPGAGPTCHCEEQPSLCSYSTW